MAFYGTKKAGYESNPQGGDFLKSRPLVYLWTEENEGF